MFRSSAVTGSLLAFLRLALLLFGVLFGSLTFRASTMAMSLDVALTVDGPWWLEGGLEVSHLK